jgi:hypothetical protein
VFVGLLSVTTFVPSSAFAAGLGAQIGVSATVIANAVAKVEHQRGEIEVEQSDVARGYVDVTNATRFSVRTNSRNGYLMVFYPLLDIFESVQVIDANIRTHIAKDGGEVVHRDSLPAESIQTLSYRFFLSPSVQPGTYPFPLQMRVRALDVQTLAVSE